MAESKRNVEPRTEVLHRTLRRATVRRLERRPDDGDHEFNVKFGVEIAIESFPPAPELQATVGTKLEPRLRLKSSDSREWMKNFEFSEMISLAEEALLPREIWYIVLQFLSTVSVLRLECTNRFWREFTEKHLETMNLPKQCLQPRSHAPTLLFRPLGELLTHFTEPTNFPLPLTTFQHHLKWILNFKNLRSLTLEFGQCNVQSP